MRERKNALVLFSKPPIPGLVKTRLTRLKDGIFEPEVASGLYHCMLFDVVEICCAAMTKMEQDSEAQVMALREDGIPEDEIVRDTFELIISTTPEKNVAVMEKLFSNGLVTWCLSAIQARALTSITTIRSAKRGSAAPIAFSPWVLTCRRCTRRT